MGCENCANWKCGELTYDELIERWSNSIGGELTPGHLKRYEKVAKRKGIEFEDVTIGFKYCSKGKLTRFYLMRGENDHKAMKRMDGCPQFSEHNEGLEVTPSIMRICTFESHGHSQVQGVNFTPGLYEGQYMRVPLYGSTRPTIERIDSECSICGKETNRALVLRIQKAFCCNRHYLEWWARRYREEYKRLKGELHV